MDNTLKNLMSHNILFSFEAKLSTFKLKSKTLGKVYKPPQYHKKAILFIPTTVPPH